ncbi:MAG: hypothetical protein AAGJ35_12025, partial [Myxococcota bacterium]
GLLPCAPSKGNYRDFYQASSSQVWEITLADTGHMQFLKDRSSNPLLWAACAAGTNEDRNVADIAMTMMVAWAEKLYHSANIEAYTKGSWAEQIKSQAHKTRLKPFHL